MVLKEKCYLPSEEERKWVKRKIEEVKEKVSSALNECGLDYKEIVPGGSTARDTFLPGDSDFDIFVLTEDPESCLKCASEKIRNGNIKPGHLKIWNFKTDDGATVDLVFVHPKEREKWFTLEHTKIYSSFSEKEKEMVRKLKALMKEECAYGAENGGITGVAIEEGVRSFGENICENLREDLWLQDPTANRPRNLLASVSKEKWELVKEACSLEREPNCDYCNSDKFLKKMENKGYRVVVLQNKYPTKDKNYQKAKSICYKSCRKIGDLEECICDAYSDREKTVVAFKVKPEELPPTKMRCVSADAPEIAIEKFKEKHPDWFYDEQGRVCVEVKRDVTDVVSEMINNIESEWVSS